MTLGPFQQRQCLECRASLMQLNFSAHDKRTVEEKSKKKRNKDSNAIVRNSFWFFFEERNIEEKHTKTYYN